MSYIMPSEHSESGDRIAPLALTITLRAYNERNARMVEITDVGSAFRDASDCARQNVK